MARRFRLSVFSLALAAAATAHAAELGDPRVVSHIGQPLVADIELTLLEDAATPVQVRVASPEVYNGAGIAVPSVLGGLGLSVTRRDGRQFLRVTSARAVDADHVHLYLELVDRGQRAVRLATLWLTPDPNPAPAPAPVVVAPHTAAPAPAPLPASDAALLAQVERARAARVAASAASVPPAPAAGTAAPVRPARAAAPHPASAPKAPAAAAKVAAQPAAHADAQPAACARPAAEAQSCVALGAKNDALRARLGLVEERMQKLQATLGAAPAAAAQAGHGAAGDKAPAQAGGPVPKTAEAQSPARVEHGRTAAAGPAASGTDAHPAATAGDAASKTMPAAEGAHKAPDKAAAAGEEHKAAAHGAGDGAHQAPAADAAPDGGHGAAPAAAATPPREAPQLAVPAGPRPIHSIKPLVPHKPKAAPAPDGGLPWGWIGAAVAVLAAGGAGAFVVVRRRKAGAAGGEPDAAAGVPDAATAAAAGPAGASSGLLARLKARFSARKHPPQTEAGTPAAAAQAAEPTFE